MGHSVEWPQERSSHAATHLSGPLFVIVGGMDKPYNSLHAFLPHVPLLRKNKIFEVGALLINLPYVPLLRITNFLNWRAFN